jgi:hypothetical protein
MNEIIIAGLVGGMAGLVGIRIAKWLKKKRGRRRGGWGDKEKRR